MTTAAIGRNGGGDVDPTAVKTVELPMEFLRWFLAQSSEDYRVPALEVYSPDAATAEVRETTVRRVSADVQATKDGFAAFHAWVRGVAEKGDRVVLGRTSNTLELQEIIDAEWAEARRELGMGDGDGVVAGSGDAAAIEDGEGAMAAASPSSKSKVKVPRSPHLQTLSIYLSLIYQRMT